MLTLIEDAGRDKSSYVLRYEEIKLPSRDNVGNEFSLSEEC
jgi:hypothetical protein